MLSSTPTQVDNDLGPLADQLPVGICLIDREYQIVLWNATLEKWTGQTMTEVAGHKLLELFPSLNQESYCERLESVFATGGSQAFEGEADRHFIPAQDNPDLSADDASASDSDQQLMIQRTTVSRHNTDSNLALVVIEDVTAQVREAEARRRQQRQSSHLAQKLAASNWQHTEFIANMSQELRQPLDTILGYAEFLREVEIAPERRAAMEGLRRNGERMVTVINEVLDFAKIEAQQVRIDRISFDLQAMLREIVSLIRLTASEQGLEFAFEADNKLPPQLCSDPTRIRQILLNLLTNAVTFTERGKISLRVVLRPTSSGEELQFEVADTGMGIGPKLMPALFQPFNQAGEKATPRSRGTGLGLAISERLTRLLGGTLTVDSEVNVGSTFTLTLPLS